MYDNTNLLTPSTPTVRTGGVRDAPPEVYTASGMRVPDADVRARRVADQAVRWLDFAGARSRMRSETLLDKAVQSVAFSASHGARHLAVPTKLAGTAKHQAALWALVRDPVAPWAELTLDIVAVDAARGSGGRQLVASFDGETLGRVQTKHAPWLRPLLGFGARLHLSRVTGAPYGYTLGVNVVVATGEALDRLLGALADTGSEGTSGDGISSAVSTAVFGPPALAVPSGDGAQRAADLAVPQHDALQSGNSPTGDDARSPLGRAAQDWVPVRAEHEALTGDADDVVLFRQLDGTASMSVAHCVRRSPSGIEWGYTGAGPSDLAWSVLSAIADEGVAERLAERFKTDVVARVPEAGGVLAARDIRAWIARHDDSHHELASGTLSEDQATA